MNREVKNSNFANCHLVLDGYVAAARAGEPTRDATGPRQGRDESPINRIKLGPERRRRVGLIHSASMRLNRTVTTWCSQKADEVVHPVGISWLTL